METEFCTTVGPNYLMIDGSNCLCQENNSRFLILNEILLEVNVKQILNLLLKLPVADNCDVELLFRPIPLLAPLFRSCVDVSLFGDLWSICLPRRPSRPVSPTAVSLKLPSKIMQEQIIMFIYDFKKVTTFELP